MKRGFLKMTLSLLLVGSCMISSCGQGDDAGSVMEPSGIGSTPVTEAPTETTTAPEAETTVATTGGEEPPTLQEIKRLIPKVFTTAAIVGRTVDQKVTVNIYQDVNIGLDYHGWPSMCMDENGVLYVAASLRIQHVDPFGCNVLYKSTDGGVTWTEPRIINDGPLDDRDAGLLYMGNGKMMLTWFTHYATDYLDGGKYSGWMSNVTEAQRQAIRDKYATLEGLVAKRSSYIRVSEDYGETWGETYRVPVSSPHGPTVLKSGEIFYIGREWNSADCGIPLQSGELYAFASTDDGKTWTYRSWLKKPEGNQGSFVEPHTIQLSNGRILCAIRVEGNSGAQYDFTIFTCFSDDNGYTWSEMEELAINGSPPHLLELDNGVLVMTYARREHTQGQFAVLSYDGGETWNLSTEIRLSFANNWDIGYPATVQLLDGTLISIYYQKHPGDSKCSILYTKWDLLTLEEATKELEK